MRPVTFGCAMSLDGYIAGPSGEYDWITMDPDIDFGAANERFDTFLIGRKTFEAMVRMAGEVQAAPGIENIVFSRTLRPEDYPNVTIRADAVTFVAELREREGKDISLFGGGDLFRSLLTAGLVDRLEVGVMPVLLGGGIPLLPHSVSRTALRLREERVYRKTGIVGLEYDIVQG